MKPIFWQLVSGAVWKLLEVAAFRGGLILLLAGLVPALIKPPLSTLLLAPLLALTLLLAFMALAVASKLLAFGFAVRQCHCVMLI